MSFFSFFFQNTVRLFPKRLNTEKKKKKLHEMCYCNVRTLQTKSTMYKQWKQNSRSFAKKVLVIKLDPPQKFRQIDAPDGEYAPNMTLYQERSQGEQGGNCPQNFTLPPKKFQINVIFNKISYISCPNTLLCPPPPK